jgi:predicted ATPase
MHAMLTRLRVTGFKNLVDVDVRLGPFTCVAGVNGVGKSNLFDAIAFLSALASKPLAKAALSVREEGVKAGDVRRLFHQVGETFDPVMRFEVEMIVPKAVSDEYGQTAKATTTFLAYTLELGLKTAADAIGGDQLEVLEEKLTYLPRNTAGERLLFPHAPGAWRNSVLEGARRGAGYISTVSGDNGGRIILHQDGGSRGRGDTRSAEALRRTVLSGVNDAESPTCLCAKREMESWCILQLEPSALRQPDELSAPRHLDAHGRHLPATLYHLAKSASAASGGAEGVYCRVANRLSELIGGVHRVWVERDEKRELLTLMVSERDGSAYPARSLSDGTLRFLALSVMALDAESPGLVCLEEPENGIHPERIPAMLELLQDVAMDTELEVDDTNPLRQVIVNTHSPSVVAEVPDGSLIVAMNREACRGEHRFAIAAFGCLPDDWRTKGKPPAPIVPKGDVLAYLNPASLRSEPVERLAVAEKPPLPDHPVRRKRVIDRPDLQPLLPSLNVE